MSLLSDSRPLGVKRDRIENAICVFLGIFAIPLLAMIGGAAPPADNSEAVPQLKSIVITDESGRAIHIGNAKHASGKELFGMTLTDARNIPRLLLHINESASAFFECADKTGDIRIQAYVLPSGSSQMLMSHPASSPQLALIQSPHEGTIVLKRAGNGAAIYLGAGNNGRGMVKVRGTGDHLNAVMGDFAGQMPTGFNLTDENKDMVRASFGIDTGFSALRLWDADSNEGAGIVVAGNGAARWSLRRGQSRAGLNAGITTDGTTAFFLTQHDGKTIFRAP